MKNSVPSRRPRPLFVAGLALGLFLASHTFSFAQTSTWNNAGSGNWDVGGNWLGGVPTGATTALFNNGGTAQLPGSVSGTYIQLQIGTSSGGSGSLEVSGGGLSGTTTYLGWAAGGMGSATVSSGTWDNSGTLSVGSSGTGSLLVDGGLVKSNYGIIGNGTGSEGSATVSSGTWDNSGTLSVGLFGTGSLLVNGGLVKNNHGYIGTNGGSEGSATVSSGTWDNTNYLYVGYQGTGSLLVDGGLVKNSTGYIGNNGGSVGSATVSSGTWDNSNNFYVGLFGTGSLLVNGGLVKNSTGFIGYSAGSEGSATVSSGTWSNSGDLSVGLSGTGTLTASGGLVSADTIALGVAGSGVGSLILSGSGVVQTSQISEGAGTGTILLDGGTLRAAAAQADFLSGFEPGDVTIGAGGAYIDSNGFDIGISTAMSGPGGLTKQGLSTLTLTGANSYFGGTIIKSGTLAVGGGGEINHVGANISVGDTSGDNGSLLVNGGLVKSSSGYIGNNGGSVGSATVSSGTWDNTNNLYVGASGTGSLLVNGGLVTNSTGYIGFNGGSEGSVTVSIGTWSNLGNLYVGNSGTGSLLVDGGLVTNSIGYIGRSGGSVGNATVSSGMWSNSNDLFVGNSGTGSLLVNGGLVTNSSGRIGYGPGSEGTATVSSGMWSNSSDLIVGAFGTGSLLVNGGLVTSSYGYIGLGGGSMGSATVSSGAWSDSGDLIVGYSGKGSLLVDGGLVTNTYGFIGYQPGSDGSATVSSGTWSNSVTLHVGNSGTGSLLVNGGLVTNSDGYIGSITGSVGSATVSSGTWNTSSYLIVGLSGTGSLLVNGGLVTNSYGEIGSAPGGVGSATVSSGTWSNSSGLSVGDSGTGSLLVDGGLVTNSDGYIGLVGGSMGSATVSSGTWSNSSDLYVGLYGTGSLLVDGGLVTNSTGYIGYAGVSVGSATVSSGTWSNSSDLYVGGLFRMGSLLVNGGLVTNSIGYIGAYGGSEGSATVSSGTWSNSGDLYVGFFGTGSLNLTDTGVMSIGAGSGTATVARNAGSVGTLNIGTGTTAGTLLAAEVHGGSGTAEVNFNHTGTLNFAPQLTGSLSVNKLAAGTTILTGSNTYSGPTDIQAGTLRVNGVNSGTGAVTVQSGGTLSGTGTIAGAITVQNGGILSPGNSPGTLNVASLMLNALAISDFELGTSSDLVVVDTDFNLDGILNVTDSGGFANTGYTLFTYGGALTNNYFELNLVPTGYNRANFVVDTSMSGTVRLLVDNTVTIQNWSGTNTSPNGAINGGDGTWNNVLTNWTNTNGSLNTEWQGVVGVFSGTAGTVNVTDVVDFQQLQFATDGYVVEDGGGALAITGPSSEIWTDSGVGAEISAAITGTGALVKTGLGTLALTGSNSHSGGTTLNTGTLLVGDDEALGAGALSLGDGTTFGVVSGGFAALINDVTVNGNINLSLAGNGFLILEGTVDLGAATRTLTFTEDLGEICLMGDVIGAGGLNLVMSGPGISSLVTMCGPDSNTYTGLTTVGDGVELELLKDPGVTAIAGDLTVDAGGIVTLFDTSEQIHPASTVTVNGILGILALSGTTTQTIGNLQGTGAIINTVGPTILTVKEGNFSGSILDGGADPLALIKSGPGTLSLSNANAFRGGTTIDAGRLQTLDPSALGSGPVALNGGSLAPGGTLTIDSLTWSGGILSMAVGTSGNSLLEVTNDLTNGGSGGQFVFSGTTGFAANTLFPLVTVGGMLNGFTLTDFNGNNLFGLAPEFSFSGTTLSVRFNGSSSGPLLQNVGGPFTPETADFLVNGVVQTGGPADDNTVNSLLFNPGSNLRIFNNLTVTSGDFTVGGGRATMTGGNVIVPGAFNKLGGGLLNLISNVLVNGPANVRAGSLLVNGIFTTGGGLTVFQNALLGGSGIINGDVFNRGTVSPGNSPGTLTINGNFTQTSSGTLLIEIASPSVFDRLVVSGNASLAGTLQAMNFGGNNLKYGQQFAFLQAGSISGEFDQILMPDPDKFRGRFLVEGGTGTLLVAPTSYTLVAETTNQRNVAKALDSFIPARGDDREVVSIALDLQSEDQYPAAFDQIAPTFYESLTDITIEQINAHNQMLVQRLGSLRLGARGFQAIGIESPLMNDKDGKSVLDAKDGKDILAPSADNHWGAFAIGNGIFAQASPANQLSNYHFEGGGFAAGLDYRWSDNFATGVYVGYQGAYARYDDGSTASINGVNFGGFATYKNGGFYADAILGGGYNGYDVRRSIEFSNVNRTARSNPGGGNLTTYLNTGYDWQAGRFTFGPILGGQYTYAGIGSFTESNAESLNLKVGQQNANSIRTTLGGHVAYTWKLTEHITIIPEVRMFWQHEFLENPRNIGASLDSGSGPSFGYETSTPDRDAVFAGAGVSAQFGENWNAFFFYNADFGRQDYLGNYVSGGLTWKF